MRTTLGVLVGALLLAAPAQAWHQPGSSVKQFGILSVQKAYGPPVPMTGFYPATAGAGVPAGSFVPAASYAMPAYTTAPSAGYALPASYGAPASFVPMSAPPAAAYFSIPAAAPSYGAPAASYGCSGSAAGYAGYTGGYGAAPAAAFPVDPFTLATFLIGRLGPHLVGCGGGGSGGSGGTSQDLQNLTTKVGDLDRRLDKLKGLESAAEDIASLKAKATKQDDRNLEFMKRLSDLEKKNQDFATRAELEKRIEDLRKELMK